MKAPPNRVSFRQARLLALVFLASTAPPLSAQTLTVNVAGDALRVQARGFGFIEGALLARLKEGRSVRVDFEISVLAKPEGPVLKQAVHTFTLSFDLWEERLAVSSTGPPARSISHLRARDAETWCLENLTMPVSTLGLGRGAPFWLRLAYRAQDPAPATQEAQGERYTLRALIDRLSRRGEEADLARSLDAGPFRLP